MLRHVLLVTAILVAALARPLHALTWPLWHWADESCDGSVATLRADQALFYTAPSAFGPPLSPAGLTGTLAAADPLDACGPLAPVPKASIIVAARGGCSFQSKAAAATAAGGAALVVFQAGGNDGGGGQQARCFWVGAPANASAAALAALLPTVSTDAESGRAMLAAQGRHATLALPDLAGPDPGAAILASLALAGVALGARAAARDELGLGSDGGEGVEEEDEAGLLAGATPHHHAPPPTLDGRAALALVAGMAGVLVTAWLLPGLAGWVLSGGFLVGSTDAGARAVGAGLRAVGVPRPAARAGAAAAAAAAAALWLARGPRGAWPLHDALALALAATVPRALRLGSLAAALTLLAAAAANDVWWVFLQPAVTGGPSLMVAVATTTPALVFLAPLLKGGPHAGAGLLGLGDVVIPGLAVAAVARWEAGRSARRGSRAFLTRWRCTAAAVAGYGAGLVATYAALLAGVGGGAGQPALIYLSPAVGGAAVCAAAVGGELRAQWGGVGVGEGDDGGEGEGEAVGA